MGAVRSTPITVEVDGEQVVLRFPALPEGAQVRNLPALGGKTRSGKNAYWLPVNFREAEWKDQVLDALAQIISVWQE